MSATLHREHWNGQPAPLGELFILRKATDRKQLEAVCQLWTHALGWEVRLDADSELLQSEVCRSQDAVFTAGEAWKEAMRAKGWR